MVAYVRKVRDTESTLKSQHEKLMRFLVKTVNSRFEIYILLLEIKNISTEKYTFNEIKYF